MRYPFGLDSNFPGFRRVPFFDGEHCEVGRNQAAVTQAKLPADLARFLVCGKSARTIPRSKKADKLTKPDLIQPWSAALDRLAGAAPALPSRASSSSAARNTIGAVTPLASTIARAALGGGAQREASFS